MHDTSSSSSTTSSSRHHSTGILVMESYAPATRTPVFHPHCARHCRLRCPLVLVLVLWWLSWYIPSRMADWGSISVATCSKAFHINTYTYTSMFYGGCVSNQVMWSLYLSERVESDFTTTHALHISSMYILYIWGIRPVLRKSTILSTAGHQHHLGQAKPSQARPAARLCIHCIFICSAQVCWLFILPGAELFTFSAWRAQNKTPFVGIHGVWII